MLYHLSGHLQKQPKGKHKLNKVDCAQGCVFGGQGRGKLRRWSRELSPPERGCPGDSPGATSTLGVVTEGGKECQMPDPSKIQSWPWCQVGLGSMLAPPPSSGVTSAKSVASPILSLLIYNVGTGMPTSEVALSMWGEKGGACLSQTLSKLSLCQFPVLPAGPALPCLTQGVFGEKPNLPEYKVAAIRKSPFILLHCGALRATWDGFILLATLYVAVTVPYSVCVSTAREPSAARSAPSVCDLAVEVLFILGTCALCLPPHPVPGTPRVLMGRVYKIGRAHV